MFLYNVAFSLEFITIGLGAFLIAWGIYKNECVVDRLDRENLRTNTAATADVTSKTYSRKRCCGGTGFAKTIGTIIIILAILNLIDTIYCTVKYRHFMGRMHNRIENMKMNKLNNSNMNNNTNTPSSSPDNSSTDSSPSTDTGSSSSNQSSGY